MPAGRDNRCTGVGEPFPLGHCRQIAGRGAMHAMELQRALTNCEKGAAACRIRDGQQKKQLHIEREEMQR
jgi:hypothetical protein